MPALFFIPSAQSSYIAQWARTINRIENRLISPDGLERLTASDFSAQNYQNAEDFCSIIIETRL